MALPLAVLVLTAGQCNDAPNRPNDAPSLASIDDQRTVMNEAIDVPVAIGDEDPDGVTIGATSDDQTLVADGDLEVSGGGADRTLRVTPAAMGFGSVTIELVARDAQGLEGAVSFGLEVGRPFEMELAKLAANDVAEGDRFGTSVAISSKRAIVGALLDDDDGASSGSAYVFVRSGETWSEISKLTASDADEEDFFGQSVAMSGDDVLIGASGNDDDGERSGSAYVFRRNGESWQETNKLAASDAAAGDFFGSSVAVDGDYALVGAFGNDDDGERSGSAYVFRRSGNAWTEVAKLTADDAAADAEFGYAVAIDGDFAIVGARADDDAGTDSGSAYVFRRSGDAWNQVEKIVARDADEGDFFGSSVAIAEDVALVGAFGNDDDGASSGSAYVFRRSGDAWNESVALTSSDATEGDAFGFAVAVSGTYALVGAIGDDDDGASSGSAYVFQRIGDDWVETTKLTASDAAGGDLFGASLAIDGDDALIGARVADDGGTDSGSAYAYRK